MIDGRSRSLLPPSFAASAVSAEFGLRFSVTNEGSGDLTVNRRQNHRVTSNLGLSSNTRVEWIGAPDSGVCNVALSRLAACRPRAWTISRCLPGQGG